MSMPWRRTLAIYLAYRVARGHTDCPATEAAREAAEVWSRTAGRSLPAELVELWRVVAGVDFNGTVLFGPVERPEPGYLAGLVETNMLLEPPAPHVHIGSYGDELLSWNSTDGSYAMVDRVSDVSMPAYDSWEELVEEHLGRHLVEWAQKRAPELLA